MEHSDNQIPTCDTNCERYCSHHTIGAHCRTEDDIQIRHNSHQHAPERSNTTLSIPTSAPNEQTPKIRALRPLGTLSGPLRRRKQTQPRACIGTAPGGDGKRRGGSGDVGNDAGDAGGGGGDDGRGIACASRAQTRVSMCVSANGSTRRDAHAWAGVSGHTWARVVALAVLEDPPSPPVRAGPINVMGRAVHSRVHALSGQPRARHCPDCAEDGSRVA